MRHLLRRLQLTHLIDLLTPAVTKDVFLHWNNSLPTQYGFRVDVDEQQARTMAWGLRDLGFTGEFFYGVTKLVFPHKSGFVVKAPIIEEFAPFMESECAFIRSIPKRLQWAFAETFWIPLGCGLVVQQRVQCDEQQYRKDEPRIKQIAQELNLYDVRHANVGFDRNGGFKLFDVQAKHEAHMIRDFVPKGVGRRMENKKVRSWVDRHAVRV